MPDAPATPLASEPDETQPEVAPADGVRRRAWLLWGLAAAAFVFLLGACDVYNYDVGLHMAKGRWILEHHSLPRPEEFITAKRPGFVYQDRWLFQVGTWVAYQAGGWAGLTLVKIGFLWLTMALLWTGSRPAGPAACALATLLAALLMYERWDIRSELSIHLIFAAMIAIAARGGPPGKWVWAAPAVAAIGANIHSVNVAAPGLLAIPAIESWWRGKRSEAKTWGAAMAASFAALLLNPQGWQVVRVPYDYMVRYRNGPDWYRGWITEMQGVTEDVSFPSVALRAIWVVVPLAALLLAANRRRARLFDVALIAGGALAAFSFRRNIGIAGVLLFPVLARNAHDVALEIGLHFVPATALRVRTAACAALAAALALVALLWTTDLVAIGERTSRREGFGLSRISLPVDACDFLEREGFVGHAFVNWDAGPYYNLRRFPQSLPCMNAEGDWNLETLKEFNEAAESPEENFEAYAARYALELVLLTHQSNGTRTVTRWLSQSPKWALVWRDECAVVFAKREGPNAERVKKCAAHAEAPPCESKDSSRFGPWGEGARRAAAVRAYRIGTLHALFNDPAQRTCYEQAIRLWPGYPEAHNNLGAYLAQRSETGAEEEFREAIRLAPGYPSPRRNLSKWYLSRGDEPGAARELESALDQAESAEVMVDLATLLLQRGDPASMERAGALAERALQLRPGHPGAMHLRDLLKSLPRR